MKAVTARCPTASLASLALLLACSWVSFGWAAEDADAREPPRIVSLAPHLTELAFAAGIGGTLVGAVEWSDYPAAAASLPRVGDAFRFDLERIVRLKATHALAWGGGTPPNAIAELESLGVVVEIIEIRTLEQIGATIERLGMLGGNRGIAKSAAENFRAGLSRFRARRKPTETLIPVFYQVSEKPLFTLGGKHVINEVLELCGSTNVFGSLDTEAASVDLEAVLARDPMAIVIGDNAAADRAASEITRWQSYPGLRAVACDNVLKVDPALLVRPTPRVLDGASRLCAWLDEEVRSADTPACSIDRD